MIDNRYWDNTGVSADTAIEQARGEWERMYRDAKEAGREIPVVDVPASLGDVARSSVEATTELTRRGNRKSFIVNIDLRALEQAARAEEARRQQEAADTLAAAQLAEREAIRAKDRARNASRSRREVSRRAKRTAR